MMLLRISAFLMCTTQVSLYFSLFVKHSKLKGGMRLLFTLVDYGEKIVQLESQRADDGSSATPA